MSLCCQQSSEVNIENSLSHFNYLRRSLHPFSVNQNGPFANLPIDQFKEAVPWTVSKPNQAVDNATITAEC